MKEFMIDLETLGTQQNSVFLSLCARQFSLDGKLGSSFYMNIELENAMKWGLSIDASTLKWWLEQRPEIMKKMFKNPEPLPSVLNSFTQWVDATKVTRPWGNSAAFDLGVLGNAYKKCGIQPPWSFWNEMCFRTIMNLNGGKPTTIKKDETKAHDPVYDCEFQIACLAEVLKVTRV